MTEYRLSKVKKYLKTLDIDTILVTNPITARYISGFKSSNLYLLISKKRNLLITDFRYKSAAIKFCQRNNFWQFHEVSKNPFSIFSNFIAEKTRLGIQSDYLTLDHYDLLKKNLKKRKLVKLGNVLSKIPMVKLKSEIKSIKQATKISDKAFEALLSEIKIGMTEKKVRDILEHYCRELGSERPSFETIVLFGSRSVHPHGTPSNRKLRKGDWILIDFGCSVNDFCSDMTRTLIMGSANKRQKDIYHIVKEAHNQAIKSICPGIESSAVDQCARSVISEAGYGEVFGHNTGHGVGLQVHELPRISKDSKICLEANMVITIEPGIYVPGLGGVRIEDLVVVTETSKRKLSRTSCELIEL